MNTENEQANESVASMRYFNRAKIKEHALVCSKKLRAGNFDRVSGEFIDSVQSEAERILKQAIAMHQSQVHDIVVPDGEPQFITGAFVNQFKDIYNKLVPRIVQSKVQRHPSVGKTLKA